MKRLGETRRDSERQRATGRNRDRLGEKGLTGRDRYRQR